MGGDSSVLNSYPELILPAAILMRTIWRCSITVSVLLVSFSCVPICFAQSNGQLDSLCDLQNTAKQGSRVNVRISGIYDGLDMGVIHDPTCPEQQTWVELALQSQQNRRKLGKLAEKWQQASVVFVGEFFGPPAPDPKVPENIRKAYHPGWGHLGKFPTKLVVHVIEIVEPANGGRPH